MTYIGLNVQRVQSYYSRRHTKVNTNRTEVRIGDTNSGYTGVRKEDGFGDNDGWVLLTLFDTTYYLYGVRR